MAGHLATPFSLGALPAPIHEIARILTGSVDFTVPGSEKIIKSRVNYMTYADALTSPLAVTRAVSESLDLETYSRFLENSKFRNVNFFKSLRDEVAQCVFCLQKSNSVEAFIHLYRCIEFMSEACGVLYISYQDDFTQSMEFFKAVHNDESMGPIGLLSRTSEYISKSEEIEELYFDFVPSGLDQEHITALGSQLNSIGIKDMQGVDKFWDDTYGYKVSVKFSEVPKFISTVRTRIYHNQRSIKNIDLFKVGGFSGLAEMLTSPTLSWFATMYFTLLRALIKRSA